MARGLGTANRQTGQISGALSEPDPLKGRPQRSRVWATKRRRPPKSPAAPPKIALPKSQKQADLHDIREMALFRATSNPHLSPKLAAAYRRFGASAEFGAPAASADEPLSLRQGVVREAVIEVIMESDVVLPTLEIQRRVVARLGRPVKRHTVDTRLYDVVADPTLPIVKVGPARYARADGAGADGVDLEPQMGAVKDQVLAVLEVSPAPMRPVEIWSAVEAEADEKVSYNAVASFLSLAAKHPDISIARVRRGWYALV